MAEIVLDGVTKRYPDGAVAVQDVSIDVADGEFIILVGPSGCGKSTTLNMVAGLEDITEGRLLIDGTLVNDRAPKDRDIAMVFQSYALYPHMTVRENMAFPLKLAHVDKATIAQKVEQAAQMLELTDHLDRRPANLSGGQRQRVAMGRAIVRSPKAFLMDEPLSNLDAKLRVQMRTQVSRIQKQLATTTIYVTHDQTEAMTLGDRVVVMRAGLVQQIGSPQELYEHPQNLFVAGFIGSPSMNFLPATVEENQVRSPLGDAPLTDAARRALEAAGAPRSVLLGIRPEHFEDAALVTGQELEHGGTFRATVDVLESMGSDAYAYFTLEGQRTSTAELDELARDSGSADLGPATNQIVTRLDAATTVREGQFAEIWYDARAMQLFDPESGANLTLETEAPVATGGEVSDEAPTA